MLLAPCEHGTQLFPVIRSGLAVWQRAGDKPGCYFYELHPNKSHFQKGLKRVFNVSREHNSAKAQQSN